MNKIEIAVVGGGIAGLALTRALIKNGHRVHLFESNSGAYQASIRNFGLIWPSGQEGELFDIAMKSRSLWVEAANECRFHLAENGSLYLAHHTSELDVINWYASKYHDKTGRPRLLSPADTLEKSSFVQSKGLKAGLFCPADATVRPLEACRQIERYLSEHPLVEMHALEHVLHAEGNVLYTAKGTYEADHIYVASGDKFRDWFPDLYKKSGSRLCKLHMLRTNPVAVKTTPTPTICGGLTLLHYASFNEAPQLNALRETLQLKWPYQIEHGIHVLIAQHEDGSLTIGDSHHYGDDLLPFDMEEVYEAILEYTHKIGHILDMKISERWQGVYAKSKDGLPLVEKITDKMTFVGALGGAGMTLSMGLADAVVNDRMPKDIDLSSKRYDHKEASTNEGKRVLA